KYRPRTLHELVGQDVNVEILQNSARAGKIGHAYLFYGSRGTGKTTTARLIAKLLNCEVLATNAAAKKRGEPCNECRSCKEIDKNISLDVVEIDAASNRGIEEIRNLKEHIRTAPAAGRYKVYIIDEAHMLTGAAFNALLKTLEEPPAHAVFILATTEYDKLPATITSRTQRFIFRKPSKEIIVSKLAHIAKEEKIDADPDALELIAAASEGSFRDAESLLDQASTSSKKVSVKSVEEMTGRVGLRRIEQLAKHIVEKDLESALKSLSDLSEEGRNVSQVACDLIHYLRKVLSLSLNANLESVFYGELTKDEIATLRALAQKTKPQELIPLIKSLIRGYGEMRYSPFATIPIEVALIEHLRT
ncbi:MAG: DNA polymerase III subunit gamma/tau, partial [Candidatus Liptonbacteria bacterium]